MTHLPEFQAPPVEEVALDVQFRAIPRLRGLELAPLRDLWRSAYPRVEEQMPLPPVSEGSKVSGRAFQVNVGPSPIRYWFLNKTGANLLQLQPDRFSLNWRNGNNEEYPRYPYMRNLFEQRINEIANFVAKEGLGKLDITQAEISYINAIDVEPDAVGKLGQLLKGWPAKTSHHLGHPEQARVNLVFRVPNIGQGPVRMHISVEPAQRPNGRSVLFMSLTVRGNPGGEGISETLKFMDSAHEHIVRSFTEITTETLHSVWRRSL